MRLLKYLLFVLFATAFVIGSVFFVENRQSDVFTYVSSSLKGTSENLAAVFFRESTTIAELNQKYKNAPRSQNKINLLIVPGHEPDLGGAKFGKLKERDMAVDLGNYLTGFLRNNDHYNIVTTRDKQNWSPTFSNYFASNWDAIIAFVEKQKQQMRSLTDVGLVKTVSGAYHSTVTQDVALRLYGINKWANENDIDIEIHVHFNDYPRRHQTLPGDYSGLTIYVPESQYSNSTATRAIASSVLNRLSKYNAVSNLPRENAGVVEDQDLIAIGSNNNVDSASMLIEYGYIYEPQFQDPAVMDMTIKDLAYQTYLGLEDFFGSQSSSVATYDTLMLPHNWQGALSKTSPKLATSDVFALQSALVFDGEYPTGSQSKNDCPRSGIFGNCTANALKSFQNKYNIKGENGVVGTKTRAVLNSMFGS